MILLTHKIVILLTHKNKRTKLGGVTTAAYGFSSVIIPPIVNSITANFGITTAFKSIGIVFLIVMCGAFYGLMRTSMASALAQNMIGMTPATISVSVLALFNTAGRIVAGYIGPTVMKNVYAADGDYKRAFIIGVVMAVVGLALTFVYRFVNNKEMAKNNVNEVS